MTAHKDKLENMRCQLVGSLVEALDSVATTGSGQLLSTMISFLPVPTVKSERLKTEKILSVVTTIRTKNLIQKLFFTRSNAEYNPPSVTKFILQVSQNTVLLTM